jgi:hypothetical protein
MDRRFEGISYLILSRYGVASGSSIDLSKWAGSRSIQYIYLLFPAKQKYPFTPVTHPCHLSLQGNLEIPPVSTPYPPRSSRVWNLLHGKYCREVTRQEINPEVRRMGYPLSQRILAQDIQIVGSRGLQFSQIPKSRHSLRSTECGILI